MKRYKMKFGNGYPSMGEDPNGEYVKWDDVKELYRIKIENISAQPVPTDSKSSFQWGDLHQAQNRVLATDRTIDVKEVQSSKKSSIPACIDCKHQTHKRLSFPQCSRKSYISPVYGECYELNNCCDERSSIFKCGKKGRYFEPKEKGNE